MEPLVDRRHEIPLPDCPAQITKHWRHLSSARINNRVAATQHTPQSPVTTTGGALGAEARGVGRGVDLYRPSQELIWTIIVWVISSNKGY